VNRRRLWFGRGRTRALLTLGVIASLGAVGTGAYWTDSAVLNGGTITAGTMDLQTSQNGSTWDAVGTGTAGTGSSINVSNLTPSEAYAFPLYVRNVGNASFTYTATVTQGSSPAWAFSSGAITVQLFAGAPVTTDTTYPIQQTCGGTALTTSAVTVTAANQSVITTSRLLAKGAVDTQLCVLVTMATSADNTNQGKQGQLRFDLSAAQVTS
jgi:predicted ribosomally synthesized peptide with SipW-like signal peptide